MTDYISREAAIGAIKKGLLPWEIADEIRAIPAADVVEVKHGQWEHTPTYWIYCSVCGREPNEYNERVNFCPYCGAQMRGLEDE